MNRKRIADPTRFVVRGHGGLLDVGFGTYLGQASTIGQAIALAQSEVRANGRDYTRVEVTRDNSRESTQLWVLFTQPVGPRADLGVFGD